MGGTITCWVETQVGEIFERILSVPTCTYTSTTDTVTKNLRAQNLFSCSAPSYMGITQIRNIIETQVGDNPNFL